MSVRPGGFKLFLLAALHSPLEIVSLELITATKREIWMRRKRESRGKGEGESGKGIKREGMKRGRYKGERRRKGEGKKEREGEREECVQSSRVKL